MELDEWIGLCRIRAFPWIDGKRIYCNVRCYAPGQSIQKPPVWDKTVYVTDDVAGAGRKLVYEFTDTFVKNVSLMQLTEGEVTLTVKPPKGELNGR